MDKFNLCPKCGGVPEYRMVGDNRNLIAMFCSECGYCAARNDAASMTRRGALRVWNKVTSRISYEKYKNHVAWIDRGKYLECPNCKVWQKKPKKTEPTPYCPICGAVVTGETPDEWIMKNCIASPQEVQE